MVLFVLLTCLYPLGHHIHITDEYLPKNLSVKVCELAICHPLNEVAIAVKKYLIKYIRVFDLWPVLAITKRF